MVERMPGCPANTQRPIMARVIILVMFIPTPTSLGRMIGTTTGIVIVTGNGAAGTGMNIGNTTGIGIDRPWFWTVAGKPTRPY